MSIIFKPQTKELEIGCMFSKKSKVNIKGVIHPRDVLIMSENDFQLFNNDEFTTVSYSAIAEGDYSSTEEVKDSMIEALTSLISDVQATGGIIEFNDGLSAPAAEPAWEDLGATILKAHDALEKEGVELRLNINVVDFPSDEAEENL